MFILFLSDRFLLSAGSDGTLFVCELMTEEMQDKEIKEYRARIPSTFVSCLMNLKKIVHSVYSRIELFVFHEELTSSEDNFLIVYC